MKLDELCSAGVHCKQCRKVLRGERWRREVSELVGLSERDFPCPHDLPWAKDKPKPQVKRLGLSERTAIKLIEDAPDEGVWRELKHALRVTRQAVDLKPQASACWRRRQFRRIRDMLTHAKRKGLITLAA